MCSHRLGHLARVVQRLASLRVPRLAHNSSPAPPDGLVVPAQVVPLGLADPRGQIRPRQLGLFKQVGILHALAVEDEYPLVAVTRPMPVAAELRQSRTQLRRLLGTAKCNVPVCPHGGLCEATRSGLPCRKNWLPHLPRRGVRGVDERTKTASSASNKFETINMPA